MNTKAVKSFGLALMLAAGVLAVLLALGTFSPQKAGAQTPATVTVSPDGGDDGFPAGNPTFLKVSFTLGGGESILPGEEIDILLPGFVLPDDIALNLINIRNGASPAQQANPADVTIGKGKITLLLSNDLELTTASNSVTFLRAAGIKAPLYAVNPNPPDPDDPITTYPVNVSYATNAGTTADQFTVARAVSLSAPKGDSDTVITVSGSGFTDGTVKIHVNQDPADSLQAVDQLASTTIEPKVANGAFETTIDVSKNLAPANNNQFLNGVNSIHVVDADATTRLAKQFNLNGKIKVAPKLIQGAEDVDVGVTEAQASAADALVCITQVTLGKDSAIIELGDAGNMLDLDEDDQTDDNVCNPATGVLVDGSGAAAFTFTVPSGSTVGDEVSLAIKGTVGSATDLVDIASTTVEVASLALTLSPGTAVQGNTVTLTGTGFSTSGTVTVDMLEIKEAGEEAGFEEVEGVSAEAVNGQFAFTLTVPDLAAGDATVRLTDSGGRVGEGTLTISAPTIVSEPDGGRKGTSVIVRGTNFPANDQVLITYGGGKDAATPVIGEIVGRAATDASGAWDTVITVPSYANVAPTKNYIQAFRPALGTGEDAIDTRPSNSVEHAVPAPSTNVSPEKGLVGATITVSGEAHPAKAAIKIKIGDSDVSETGAVTDANGDFSIDVQIPDLAQRFVALTGTVGKASITPVLIEILQPEPVPATRDVATEFAGLIDAGVLDSVFRYNADKSWSGYSPAAPAEANDLDTVNSGDILWIKVSADGESYAGRELTTEPNPWNLVVAP